MSGDDPTNKQDGIELSRRTFTKAAGVAAGGGLLGASAGTAAAEPEFENFDFANPRVRELAKVWTDRGYRGQADRAIGLIDSDLDVQHPDLGPWNEISDLILDSDDKRTKELEFSGTQEVSGGETSVYKFQASPKDDELDAKLEWTSGNDLDLRLDKSSDGGGTWNEVARSATDANPEKLEGVSLDDGADEFRLVVELNGGDATDASVSGATYDIVSTDPFESGGDSKNDDTVPVKTVGKSPNNGEKDGSGTFAASVAAGTGRASDFQEVDFETESQSVKPGVPLQYFVRAEPGESVFASAFGDNIELVITRLFTDEVFARSTVESDGSALDNNIVSYPVGRGFTEKKTFVVEIRAGQPGESVSTGRGRSATAGAGRLERAAYGRLAEPSTAGSDRAGTRSSGTDSDPKASELPFENTVSAPTGTFATDQEVALYQFTADSKRSRIDATLDWNSELSGVNSIDLRLDRKTGENEWTQEAKTDTASSEKRLSEVPITTGETYRLVADVYVNTIEEVTVNGVRYDTISMTLGEDDSDSGSGNSGPDVSLHSGVAPNAALVGLLGNDESISLLSSPSDTNKLVGRFNLRTVNISSSAIGSNRADDALLNLADAGAVAVTGASGASDFSSDGDGSPQKGLLKAAAADDRDGISSYSADLTGSGPTGPSDGPDIVAPGGSETDGVHAADRDTPEGRDGYEQRVGDEVAAPFVTGTASLVAQAMEEDAPSGLALPEPNDVGGGLNVGQAEAKRLKSVILATASTTAFTAAPYHEAERPTYRFNAPGSPDQFEGYGRVNADAAADAVSKSLTGGSFAQAPKPTDPDATPPSGGADLSLGSLGLNVPEDSRAVARYIDANSEPGSVSVTIDSLEVSGGDAGMAKGTPHVDLLLYDIGSPMENTGEPNLVASSSTLGSGTATVSTDTKGETLAVVAKLVNVPGVVNGFDVQVDLGGFYSWELDSAPQLPLPKADGNRTTPRPEYIAGENKRVTVTVDHVEALAEAGEDAEAVVWDRIPDHWDVLPAFDVENPESDVEEREGERFVRLGTVSKDEVNTSPKHGSGDKDDDKEFEYVVRSPQRNDQYTFGPAFIELEDQESKDDQVKFNGTNYRVSDERNGIEYTRTDISGTNAAYVIGGTKPPDTSSSTSPETTTESATDTVSDAADDATDTVSDGAEDATDTVSGGSSGGSDDGGTVGDAVDDTTDTVSGTTDDAKSTVSDTTDGSL